MASEPIDRNSSDLVLRWVNIAAMTPWLAAEGIVSDLKEFIPDLLSVPDRLRITVTAEQRLAAEVTLSASDGDTSDDLD